MNALLTKFGSVHVLRWLGVIVFGILLIYFVEDWRGGHAWAAAKAKWEAKGESFDREKFVPPPVPEEQNLAALPLFKLEQVAGANGKPYLSLVTLRKAMRGESPANDIPDVGKWSLGETPDLPKIRAAIRANYATIVKSPTAPESTLAQFEAIYPFLADLRAASVRRPYFRLNLDYAIDPPCDRPLGPVVDPIRISKLLAVHAILALHEHRGDLALADLQLNQQIFAGIQRDPSLVGALVAIGMRAIGNAVIFDGLAEYAWTDAQLAELEKMLQPIDFLTEYQFAMRSEVLFALGTIDYLRQPGHRAEIEKIEAPNDRPSLTAADLFAEGWWDDNKRQIAEYDFNELAVVDPQSRRVFADVALRLKRQNDEACARWDAGAPWNAFFAMTGGLSPAVEKFAEGQVSVDQTRIACALERYRLAHKVYPATLAELAPALIDEVPHDVMNGEPYGYRLNADGTFVLYSVGWNGKDDGGTVVFKEHDPKMIDYENGDWVWPAVKN